MTCGDWISGLNTVFLRVKPGTKCHRCSGTAPILSQSQATTSKHAPASNTGEKPRLRAIDLARKIQQEKTKPPAETPPVSAQQKRVADLKRFSLQLQNVHPNVLAKHLHRSVLYQDKDVVVINKPYGVPVKGKAAGAGGRLEKVHSIDLHRFHSEYSERVCERDFLIDVWDIVRKNNSYTIVSLQQKRLVN